jgi:hypothetical protein
MEELHLDAMTHIYHAKVEVKLVGSLDVSSSTYFCCLSGILSIVCGLWCLQIMLR